MAPEPQRRRLRQRLLAGSILAVLALGVIALLVPSRDAAAPLAEERGSGSIPVAATTASMRATPVTRTQDRDGAARGAPPASAPGERESGFSREALATAATPKQSVISLNSILAKNYDDIIAVIAGAAELTKAQKYAMHEAIDDFLELYVTSFRSHQEQLHAAANEVFKRGASATPPPGTRYGVVGVSTPGRHEEVRVYETEYPQAFVAKDAVDSIPSRLEARLLAIVGQRR